eukprot:gene21426-25767_t
MCLDGKKQKEEEKSDEGVNQMIGEIERMSRHHLEVKQDVETQCDFIHALGAEIQAIQVGVMDDVGVFVKWMDDELSFLVDERAVLKHFPTFPEKKVDMLREAASEYQAIALLEKGTAEWAEPPGMGCVDVCERIAQQFEAVDNKLHILMRDRDGLIQRFKPHHIPTSWLTDDSDGLVCKLKKATFNLAARYLGTIIAEVNQLPALEVENLATESATGIDPNREFLLLAEFISLLVVSMLSAQLFLNSYDHTPH